MPWNSTFPVGNISVRANRTVGQQNTTYIETVMGNSVVGTNNTTTRDHFWNVSADLDGRHRFIQSVGFTVGGNPADPVIGTNMDCVEYFKTTNGRVEGFFRNQQGIFQHIPSVLKGSVAVPSSNTYNILVAVPANVYGEIFMYTTALGRFSCVSGIFRSNGTTVEAWGLTQSDDVDDTNVPLKFGSGSETNLLNIMVRRSDAGSATWNYIVTYRAL